MTSADDSHRQPPGRGVGRPRKPPAERLRARSFALSDATYARLQTAARENGRSLSAEVEERLIGSFAVDREIRIVEWIKQTPPAQGRALCEEALARITDENGKRHVERFMSAPLARAIEIAAVNILAPGVLPSLAERLACSRSEAAEWWTDLVKTILPYVYEPSVETAET